MAQESKLLLEKYSIKSLLLGMVSCIFCGFALYSVVAWHSMERIRVNGPLYQDVVRSKDLVADVLPPPAYVVEANLTAFELAHAKDAQTRQSLIGDMTRLEHEFNERIDYWRTQPLPSEINQTMQGALADTGKTFFRVAHDELIPAIQDNKPDAAEAALNKMQNAYAAHRTAVNDVVRMAGAENARYENAGNSALEETRYTLIFIFLISTVPAGFVALWIARSLLARLGGEPAYAASVVRKIAEGDMQIDIQTLHQGDSLLGDIRDMQGKFNAVLRGIHDTNREVGQSIFQISSVSQEIAKVSSEQQKEAASVANATESLRSVSDEVQALAAHAQSNSERVSELADAGINAVGEMQSDMDKVVVQVHATDEAVSELARSGHEINAIVSSIKGIAGQTNLLALNAAIEAARAGEQGRGFAVVADEVRELATHTTAATAQIEAIVTRLNTQLAHTQTTMREVAQVASDTRSRAEGNGAAIREIANQAQESTQSSRMIASTSAQQMQQLRALHERLDRLFSTLSDSESTLGVTHTISHSLHDTVQAMQTKLDFFRIDTQRTLAEPPASKRRHSRIANTLSVSVLRANEAPVTTIAKDFSLGGLRIASPSDLGAQREDVLELEIRMPAQELDGYLRQAPIHAKARVVRSLRERDEYVYGLAFVQLDAATERAIREAIRFYTQTATA